MGAGSGIAGAPDRTERDRVDVEEPGSEPSFMDSAMAGFRELRRQAAAHTVAGSAGTFGFREASKRARALEEGLLAGDGSTRRSGDQPCP
jgi:chemotaxis protein histidine kinase CheA